MGAKNACVAGSDRSLNLAHRRQTGGFRIDLCHAGDVVIGQRPLVELGCNTERRHHRRNHCRVIQAKHVADLVRQDALDVELAGFAAR